MIASDLELGFSPQNPKSRTTYRYPALNQTQKPGLTKIWTNKASRIWWNPPNLVNPITKCNWLNQGNILNTSRHKGNWCHLNLSSCHIEVEAETWMLQTWSRLPYILHYYIIRIVNAFCNIRLYLDHTSKSPWFHSHCTFNSCIACPIYPWVRGVHSWVVWSLQRSYKPGVSFCLWSSILVQLSSKNPMILSTNTDMDDSRIPAQARMQSWSCQSCNNVFSKIWARQGLMKSQWTT
jgi:hypothetical protein